MTIRFASFWLAVTALMLPAAACAQPAPQPAADDGSAEAAAEVAPALWRVSDEDTTIYLFGSFHLLPAGIDWFDGPVREAFNASDALVIETVPPADGGGAIVQRLALADDGIALPDRLDDDDAERLAEALAGAGIPPSSLDRIDPWFATITLSVLEYRKLGMNPASGVEQVLMSAARTADKDLAGLEDFEAQLRFFEDMSMEQQVAMLVDTLDELEEISGEIDALITNWAEGDVADFAAMINGGFADSPELRELLLTNRNRNWAVWIDERLDAPGTVFIAVGAGHLAGEDSVQTFLAEHGLAAERLQ